MTTNDLKNNFAAEVKPQNDEFINYYGGDRVMLTKNILAVSSAASDSDLQEIEYKGETFDRFRAGCYFKAAVKRRNLTREDHEAIDRFFDNAHHRNQANQKVAAVISEAVTKHFSEDGQSAPECLHVYDLGCGAFPLGPKDIKGDVTFQGIDVSRNIIKDAQAKGLAITDWQKAMTTERPSGRTSIATAIYALHFMTGNKLSKRIKHLISDREGIFVGNFYTARDMATAERRSDLLKTLERDGLHVERVNDPHKTYNEYWIICKDEGMDSAQEFVATLQDTIEEHTHRKACRLDRESLNIAATPS